MTTPSTFWRDQKHQLIADMLQKQFAVERRMGLGPAYPWHRVIYTTAVKFGIRPAFDQRWRAEDLKDLLAIWAAGLSWSIRRFGLALEGPQFESLVQAVARRIGIAQSKPLPSGTRLEQLGIGVDRLVESAGRGLFNFDHFFVIARTLEHADLELLHREFMRQP
jgi:hypothetical protein